MNFPLIYCNGDSYSNENYLPELQGKVYANIVAEHYNGFVINKAISGCCNRRIIRTSVHDLVQQRQLNPTQEIIALIGLTFDLRSEIWIEGSKNKFGPEESDFKTHRFNESELELNSYGASDKHFKQYSDGRAFFYSPYSERINLLCDLIMFRALMYNLNIKFLVFQSPKAEELSSDYLLDNFKEQLKGDPRFIDFEKFGFVNWCAEQKFTPLDMQEQPFIAHYGPDAHRAFAEQIVIPTLERIK